MAIVYRAILNSQGTTVSFRHRASLHVLRVAQWLSFDQPAGIHDRNSAHPQGPPAAPWPFPNCCPVPVPALVFHLGPPSIRVNELKKCPGCLRPWSGICTAIVTASSSTSALAWICLGNQPAAQTWTTRRPFNIPSALNKQPVSFHRPTPFGFLPSWERYHLLQILGTEPLVSGGGIHPR